MSFKLSAFADEASQNIDEQIIAMKENGIEYLEIRGVDGQNISDISIEKAKEVKQKLDNAKIKVWSIGSPCGKMNIEDDFKSHFEKFCHTLEIAKILDTKYMRMFSFFIPNDKDAEMYKDEVFKRLSLFLEEAKEKDIVLCHENEKGIYGDTAKRCLEIHKIFPDIKAVFDPANFVQCKEDTIKAWDLLKDYVEYMHIKDVREDGIIVPAGEGIGNIPYLIKNYKGEVLTIEPHLAVFEGLSSLEKEGEKTQIDEYKYSSNKEAFNVATNALKKLL